MTAKAKAKEKTEVKANNRKCLQNIMDFNRFITVKIEEIISESKLMVDICQFFEKSKSPQLNLLVSSTFYTKFTNCFRRILYIFFQITINKILKKY